MASIATTQTLATEIARVIGTRRSKTTHQRRTATADVGAALVPGDGVLEIDRSRFVDLMAADCAPEVAAAALATLRPEPIVPLGTPVVLTARARGSVSRSYIHTRDERYVPPAAQSEMVAAVGVEESRSIAGDHLVMLSRPVELADALLSLAGERVTPPLEAKGHA